MDSDIEIESDDEDDSTTSEDILPVTGKERKLRYTICWVLLQLQLLFQLSDSVVTSFLKLLKALLAVLAGLCSSLILSNISKSLPKTIYLAKKITLMVTNKKYLRYIVCPTCHTLYEPTSSKMTSTDSNGIEMSSLCTYIKYPNHPHVLRRQPCNTPLMKKIKCKGRYTFKPRMLYCYRSIKESIGALMRRQDFWKNCNSWRNRSGSEGMADIYDGNVWKTFLRDGFLSSPNNLGLMLNVDWYQPFKHSTPYSLGMIYLVVLNLPRDERFKVENVMVVGVIPGPKEPRKSINTFLGPLVQELLQFWTGCWLQGSRHEMFVRAALMCISCDIPASRKVAGYVGHNAILGCSRCLKKFPTHQFGEKPNYGGFSPEIWPARDPSIQKIKAYEHLNAATEAERKEIERNYGIRYSVLYELPYLDIVRFLVVDPMHALFLGVAEHTMKV